MKAVIWQAYGPPTCVSLGKAPIPTPKAKQLRINVHASTVTRGDSRLRACDVPAGFRLLTRLVFGLFKPRTTIPGMEFAGIVEAIGPEVTQFKIGDRVFGTTGMALAAHAEYLCIDEDDVVAKLPNAIPFTEAAALLFGGITALHFLQTISANHHVLINGASGAVGIAALQLYKHFGAKVTAVCSKANLDFVVHQGADHTINYQEQDIFDSNHDYDVILDTVGNVSHHHCKRILNTNGKFITINASLALTLKSLFSKQLVCGVAMESKGLLEQIVDLYNKGILKPIIDSRFNIEEIEEAHRRVDSGHKVGSVVLILNNEPPYSA